MATAIKFNSIGEKIDEIELPAQIFEVDVNSPKVLLNEVVTQYLLNQRQGTVQKKNRAMTAGSTRKIYRQKAQEEPDRALLEILFVFMVVALSLFYLKIGIVPFPKKRSVLL
jgi:hypothetical protein